MSKCAMNAHATDTKPRQRWWRPRWLTVLAGFAVGSGLVYVNLDTIDLYTGGPSPAARYYGWPSIAVKHRLGQRRYDVSQTDVAIDIATAAALIAATWLAVERTMRCRPRLQFSLRDLFVLITAAAALFAIWRWENSVEYTFWDAQTEGIRSTPRLFEAPPYVYVPIVFSAFCLTHLLVDMGLRLAGTLFRRLGLSDRSSSLPE
jgi:hypothetical protein